MAQTLYTKMVGERQVFSSCRTLVINGVAISNPTESQIFADGWTIYVPPVVPPQPQTEPGLAEVMQAVKKMLSTEADELSDEDALDVAALFPTWASKIGQQVSVGERLWYDGKLYKVVQAHTASSEWVPDHNPALYTEVSIELWPEWRQPLGSADAYNQGDQVSHNDKHWTSDVDGNVWEPGVYGWTEVTQTA